MDYSVVQNPFPKKEKNASRSRLRNQEKLHRAVLLLKGLAVLGGFGGLLWLSYQNDKLFWNELVIVTNISILLLFIHIQSANRKN